nr:hypothetical protein [Tanacetum cinerariifolium]
MVGTVEQPYEPTTVEEKLDRKNEMKARGTLLMALPNKDQLKFHSYRDAKLLMEAIEKRLQKLISQLEIQGEVIEEEEINLKQLRRSSSTSQNPQNVDFVSSNSINSTSSANEADNTAYGISTTHTQEEMDLKWKMAMLTIRARRFIKRIGKNLDINGQKIGFDKSKVECFNCHKNGHFARECRAPKNQENRGREYGRKTVLVENLTENALIAQDRIRGYDWSYKAEEEHPTTFALMALTSSGSSSNLDSDNLEKAEKERDELKLTLEKYQNSSKSLNTLLESQENVRSKSNKRYHTVPPPYTGNYIPSKPGLMFIDEQVESESMNVVSTVLSSVVKTVESKVKYVD